MEILRRILFRLCHIGLWLTIASILVSAVLVFMMITFRLSTGFYIFSILFWIFTATNILIPLPDHVYKAKAIIHKNSFATRYVYDYEYRSSIVLQIGFFGNAIYSLVNLFLGCVSGSAWTLSIGIFYAIFGFLKFALIARQEHLLKCENMRERRAVSFRTWRFVAISLLVITVPTTVMVIQMITRGKSNYYGPVITLGFFVYTAIYTVAAIIKACQSRLRNNPIFSAYTTLSCCGAMMSILSLQTSMLVMFGVSDERRALVNSLTGSFVLASFYAISIVLIIYTTKYLGKHYPELSTLSKHRDYNKSKRSVFDKTVEIDKVDVTEKQPVLSLILNWFKK